MNILIIGGHQREAECREKFGMEHTYIHADNHHAAGASIGASEVVFDFVLESPQDTAIYERWNGVVFINTVFQSLRELTGGRKLNATAIGFNGLPTFTNRPVLEVSCYSPESVKATEAIAQRLGTQVSIVDDRVGLVTPRIICMIINEAYFTVQEGTATREDIDLAMKLGTNYPFGPFEWCQRIGIAYVYRLLAAVYDDTKDERYKICSLLKKEYLHAQVN